MIRFRVVLFQVLLFSGNYGQAQNNFHFWLNTGDCESYQKNTGLFTDTTSTIDLDYFGEKHSRIDSTTLFFNGKTETFEGLGRIKVRPETEGLFSLSAKIYTQSETIDIDTSFRVVHQPVVHLKVKRTNNFDGDNILKLCIYNEDSVNVTDQFECCVTYFTIWDSLGNKKLDGLGGLSQNLSLWKREGMVTIKEGDTIEFTYVRLLYKEINRSFVVVPKLVVKL